MDKLSFADFAVKYCERQENTPADLLTIFRRQIEQYAPEGWCLFEAQLMDSSQCGRLRILPYGPNCTYKTAPNHPVSFDGLASTTSVVIAYTLAAELPEKAPDWTPPPPPVKRRKAKST